MWDIIAFIFVLIGASGIIFACFVAWKIKVLLEESFNKQKANDNQANEIKEQFRTDALETLKQANQKFPESKKALIFIRNQLKLKKTEVSANERQHNNMGKTEGNRGGLDFY